MKKDNLFEILKLLNDEGTSVSEFHKQLTEWTNEREKDDLDFKKDWIDNEKLAKLILSMANFGGGNVIIGVEEDDDKYIPIGLQMLKDKAEVNTQLSKFLPDSLISSIEVENFEFDDEIYKSLNGKKFQCITIKSNNNDLPYLSTKDGNYISKNRIYIRRHTSVEEANNYEITQILNKKMNAIYSETKKMDLDVHISQLKLLYENVNKSKTRLVGGIANQINHTLKNSLGHVMGYEEKYRNPNYPELDFEEFISRCIYKKQKRIENELDI
ncbi:ATP-binding protein [Staphylococcus taiwanensis]|nr:ATP-binding protein [Staphylococcus taiwanensis]